MLQKKVLIILCSALFISSIWAQKAPMKFGKIDQADLEMKVYAPDSSASAIILYNYGYFDTQRFQFNHQMRIKILKEEGKIQGDFFVPAAEKAVVKGQIVNLENGVAVVTKLNKSSIFIEHVSKNQYRARVAFPNVKVGSVLDVEFYYSGLPSSWKFQETIPIRWSELILPQSEYVNFRKTSVGFIPFEISSDDRWVTKNVPAFKSEPYINNYQNYISRFDIEVSSINVPGVYYKEYATTWDAVAESLRKENNFGMALSGFHLFLNSLAKEIKLSATTDEEKVAKSFEALKKIKWNNRASIWISDSGISWPYSKKIGNVSEINMTLIVLLRKLDIEAYPLLLSTRDNGIIAPYSVSFDKFNYVAAQATIAGQNYLLDATEEYLPVGLLPERALNGRGFLLKKEAFEWVDLNTAKKNKTTSFLNLKLSPNGLLKGTWQNSSFDYAALDMRINYKTFNNQDDYLKSVENENFGLSIEDYSLENFDSLNKVIKENFSIVLKNKVTSTNNRMYISPVQIGRYSENPFKAKERLYPVDFIYSIEKAQVLRLELPEGYELEQLPKNIKMTLPEKAASFQIQYSVTENIVQAVFKLNINKPIFYQTEYQDLKLFYDELVNKQSDMLIIKKI